MEVSTLPFNELRVRLMISLQARIGGMDGIFVAYHNTKRLTGFQYLPMYVRRRALSRNT
jgi:hypothetical protein